MEEPVYTLVETDPLRMYRISIGSYSFETPAIAAGSGGRRRVPVERVTVAPRSEKSARILARRLRRVRAPLVEVVLDYSLGGVEESVARLLGETVARECPDGSYCMPPVIVSPRDVLSDYMAVLEGYTAGGGCGVSLPGYDIDAAEALLGAYGGRCFTVVDAGRRSWRRLTALRLLGGTPVYLLNIYRGGQVPRPAYELLFPLMGVDILGYSRPPLRQIAAMRGEARSGQSGLDKDRMVYVRGGGRFEEVAPLHLERLVELVRVRGLGGLEEVCPGCLEIITVVSGEGIGRVAAGEALGAELGEDSAPRLHATGAGSG